MQVCDLPKPLSHSFTAHPMRDLVTTVSWTMTLAEAGTRLHLHHSAFRAGAALFALLTMFDKGWDGPLIQMRDAII
ncbi:MAG: hypothetical protein ACI8TF_002175 [Paracoccaceae bacterium]